MMKDSDEIISGVLSSTGVLCSSLTVDACFGETSYEIGLGRGGTIDTTSAAMDYLVPKSTENPTGTAGVCTMVGTGSALSSISEEPDIIIFFRKDSVPYSRVEKNAVSIYNMLHRNKKISFGKVAIIAKTIKTYEYLKELFCSHKGSIDVTQVIAIEEVLERIANEKDELI